ESRRSGEPSSCMDGNLVPGRPVSILGVCCAKEVNPPAGKLNRIVDSGIAASSFKCDLPIGSAKPGVDCSAIRVKVSMVSEFDVQCDVRILKNKLSVIIKILSQGHFC